MEQFVFLSLDVPLYRGARGVLMDIRYTIYEVRFTKYDLKCSNAPIEK
jgi:hypothetical protein